MEWFPPSPNCTCPLSRFKSFPLCDIFFSWSLLSSLSDLPHPCFVSHLLTTISVISNDLHFCTSLLSSSDAYFSRHYFLSSSIPLWYIHQDNLSICLFSSNYYLFHSLSHPHPHSFSPWPFPPQSEIFLKTSRCQLEKSMLFCPWTFSPLLIKWSFLSPCLFSPHPPSHLDITLQFPFVSFGILFFV